jgi:putative ABC transport system ATP-binding protein
VSDASTGPRESIPALQLAGVRRTYEAETAPVRALRGVDLTVRTGDFVALMGPSGCGKSTLLHLAAGLDRPDEGSVRLAGDELTTLSESRLSKARRRHVGLVFQFFHLLEGMSVAENVSLAAMVAGASRRDADARAQELLDLLGLLDKGNGAPTTLSGGQRQRLAIARALANSPTLLLADEPTGALDSDGADEVLALFRRLHERGQSILMVTHNPDVAAGASRIVHLRDGVVTDDAAGDRLAVSGT